MLREFTTAAAESEKAKDVDKGYPFKVDGVECMAYKPTPAQTALAMASMGRHRTENDRIAAVIDFCLSVCDKPTAALLTDRLMDRDDKFELEHLQDIMEGLIEDWSGNPTQERSVSTDSPPNTGPSSTPTTPALT